MSSLAEFQAAFHEALLHPDERTEQRWGKGLRVYQNTVMTGLIDALRANYPTVERLTGDEWFAGMAKRYIHEHWPMEPALSLYGERFALYLDQCEEETELAYLSQVALLDRLWTEAHFAAQAEVLQSTWLASCAGEKLLSLPLSLHPATRLAWVSNSAFTIWQAHRPPAEPPEALQTQDDDEGVLMVRPLGEIAVWQLSLDEYSFLNQLARGDSLGEAAMQTLQEFPAADISRMLARAVQAGVFQQPAEASIYSDAEE